MKVRDMMTSNVHRLQETASLLDALKLMIGHRISGVPVVDHDGKLVGMLTEGDLLRRAETGSEVHRPAWLQFVTSNRHLAEEYVKAHGRRVSELMTPDPETIGPDATADEAVTKMLKKRVKRLPVVENGLLVGLVSRADLVKALFSRVLEEHRPKLNDEEIVQAIYKMAEEEKWAPSGTIKVEAKNGVVALEGVLFNEAARPALRVMIENIPGVVRIIDKMQWMDAMSGITIPPPNENDPFPIKLD